MRIPRQRKQVRVRPPSPPWPPEVTAIGSGRVWVLRDAAGSACVAAEGGTGLVLINTGADAAGGRAIAQTLPMLSAKPVRAIVYPHLAMRHCQGTAAIVPPAEAATGAVVIAGLPAWGTDGLTTAWPPPQTGPPEPEFPPVPPNLPVPGERQLRLAGVRLRLLPVDGQSLAVHLPEHRLAFFTEPGADPLRWVAAADVLLSARPEHLLGTELPLLSGVRRVERMLTRWRDEVQHRHDQAVRRVLDGACPDGLATTPGQLVARLRARPPGALLELLRYRLDPGRANGCRTRLRCRITDTGEQFELELRNRVLLVRRSPPPRPADASVVLGAAALAEYVAGAADLPDLLVRHAVTVDGRPEAAATFFAAFDREIRSSCAPH